MLWRGLFCVLSVSKFCSNAGFTCFETRFGPQPECLHRIRKADTPEQNSFSKSIAWNTEEMCGDQMTLVILCFRLTSLIFSVVLSWAVCQGKGTALVCLGME